MFLTILILVEILFFIGFLFYSQRRFEKKFFTVQVKKELEELVTSFNRQAETNILLLEESIKKARKQSIVSQAPDSEPDLNPVSEAVSKRPPPKAKPNTTSIATPVRELSSEAKPQPTQKKAVKLKQTPVTPPPKKLPPEANPSPTQPLRTQRTQNTQKKVVRPTQKSVPSPKKLSPRKNSPKKLSPETPSVEEELSKKILEMADAKQSLETIAKTLTISPNEVKLRLEVKRAEIHRIKNHFEKNLTS